VVAEDHPGIGILDQLPHCDGIRTLGKCVARQIEEIRTLLECQFGKQLFEFTGAAVNVADKQGSQGDSRLRNDRYKVRTDGNDGP